jgi:hypothetical protein
MLVAVNGSRKTAVKLDADGDGEMTAFPVAADALPLPAVVVADVTVDVGCC